MRGRMAQATVLVLLRRECLSALERAARPSVACVGPIAEMLGRSDKRGKDGPVVCPREPVPQKFHEHCARVGRGARRKGGKLSASQLETTEHNTRFRRHTLNGILEYSTGKRAPKRNDEVHRLRTHGGVALWERRIWTAKEDRDSFIRANNEAEELSELGSLVILGSSEWLRYFGDTMTVTASLRDSRGNMTGRFSRYRLAYPSAPMTLTKLSSRIGKSVLPKGIGVSVNTSAEPKSEHGVVSYWKTELYKLGAEVALPGPYLNVRLFVHAAWISFCNARSTTHRCSGDSSRAI
ncbi:hypothetical protein DFH09DRAFT_1286075 [Mycena vulgaris]|nr:hypothetical protein DFH09DRAFT_1286075 [Mycena vulgaris]